MSQPAAKPTRHVAVKLAREPWIEYELADGTVIRTKVSLFAFRRLVGEFQENGDPKYEWTTTMASEIIAPDGLRNVADPPKQN